MKKIPTNPARFDCLSIAFTNLLGSVISKALRKKMANTRNSTKNKIFQKALVYGIHRIRTCNDGDQKARKRVYDNDGKTVNTALRMLSARFTLFAKERNGKRDHREKARHEQCKQPPKNPPRKMPAERFSFVTYVPVPQACSSFSILSSFNLAQCAFTGTFSSGQPSLVKPATPGQRSK